MEDRDTKLKAAGQLPKKAPLLDAAVELAGNIIEKTNRDMGREVIKEATDKAKCIVLLLAC